MLSVQTYTMHAKEYAKSIGTIIHNISQELCQV